MDNSNNTLRTYHAKKSKFFSLPENEEVKVRFLRAEEIANKFDGGKTNCIRYYLEVNGVERMWDRTSAQLALLMSKVQEGEYIYILRTGEKNRTIYSIRKAE